ncbi:MAG: hypothetical protein ABII71_04820 [Candidatus Micrarchaeota archaeon]
MVRKPLCDCDYNVIKQMTKKLELLWHIESYIKDAKKCKHAECVKLFEKIKKDETAHVRQMKKILAKKIKKKE